MARAGCYLFLFWLLTSVNMVLGILLAAIRLALSLLLSVLDISRMDRSMLPYLRQFDKGYMGFYGMVLH